MSGSPSSRKVRWSREQALRLLLAAAAAMPAYGQSRPEAALLAGGCFWTMQKVFDAIPGVIATEVGFAGGRTPNPTYAQVIAGGTGHLEVVRIEFDPGTITYSQLLDHYWRAIDPTRTDEQFCDVGRQYNPTIFVLDDKQQRIAEQSKLTLESNKPFRGAVKTPIAPAPRFWPAEESHQKFYEREAARYSAYERGCGRRDRLAALWGSR